MQEEEQYKPSKKPKNGKYHPTSNLKMCGHISFERLDLNFRPDCRYLRYLRFMDSKIKGKNVV